MSHLKTIVMDSSTIERLERAKFKILIGQTVAQAAILGMLLAVQFPIGKQWTIIAAIASMPFIALYVGMRVWEGRVNRAVERDKEVFEAMNNEMYVSWKKDSYVAAFSTLMFVNLLFITFGRKIDMSAETYAVLSVFVGFLAYRVRLILYYKQS